MAQLFTPGYTNPKGIIVEGFDLNGLINQGTAVPANGTAGYATGALFFVRGAAAGLQLYINTGTTASCLFQAMGASIGGVGTGYKVARGQFTTVTASDTVVTGLATVVSAVANLETAPAIGADRANAGIGNQSGAPAAGSILIKTFKPTATGDATPIAATTFSMVVNWIAIGT